MMPTDVKWMFNMKGRGVSDEVKVAETELGPNFLFSGGCIEWHASRLTK
jgi:hypothetical protein